MFGFTFLPISENLGFNPTSAVLNSDPGADPSKLAMNAFDGNLSTCAHSTGDSTIQFLTITFHKVELIRKIVLHIPSSHAGKTENAALN